MELTDIQPSPKTHLLPSPPGFWPLNFGGLGAGSPPADALSSSLLLLLLLLQLLGDTCWLLGVGDLEENPLSEL